MEAELACPSCRTSHMGPFCASCGEKRRSHHDYSIRHYFSEVVEAVTHFDSKVLRSVWLLVSRPGLLSAEYFLGRRVRYVSPLRLFVVLSIVYYLSNSIFPYNAFTTPLASQLNMNNYYPSYAAAQVERTMSQKRVSYADLEREYNEKTAILSKTLVFSLIPVIALLLHALLFKRKKYFAEHLVVATHFWAFALVLIGVFIPVLLLLLTHLAAALEVSPTVVTADSVPTIIIQVAFAVYLFTMLRRVYGVSRWYSGLLAASVAWSFFQIVWLFRFLLFVVTLKFL